MGDTSETEIDWDTLIDYDSSSEEDEPDKERVETDTEQDQKRGVKEPYDAKKAGTSYDTSSESENK